MESGQGYTVYKEDLPTSLTSHSSLLLTLLELGQNWLASRSRIRNETLNTYLIRRYYYVPK